MLKACELIGQEIKNARLQELRAQGLALNAQSAAKGKKAQRFEKRQKAFLEELNQFDKGNFMGDVIDPRSPLSPLVMRL